MRRRISLPCRLVHLSTYWRRRLLALVWFRHSAAAASPIVRRPLSLCVAHLAALVRQNFVAREPAQIMRVPSGGTRAHQHGARVSNESEESESEIEIEIEMPKLCILSLAARSALAEARTRSPHSRGFFFFFFLSLFVSLLFAASRFQLQLKWLLGQPRFALSPPNGAQPTVSCSLHSGDPATHCHPAPTSIRATLSAEKQRRLIFCAARIYLSRFRSQHAALPGPESRSADEWSSSRLGEVSN